MIKTPNMFPETGQAFWDTSKQMVAPSDCPDGTLNVWFPDGTSTSVPGVVACCYSYPSCDPCSGHNYDSWIGDHFKTQCGDNNSKRCYYTTSCSL